MYNFGNKKKIKSLKYVWKLKPYVFEIRDKNKLNDCAEIKKESIYETMV